MSEAVALSERVAQLEAQLARLLPPVVVEPELPPVPRVSVYTPPPMIDLVVLSGSQGLTHDLREIRQLATAIALSRGDELPGAQIPADYEPQIRQLAEVRARGLSWRASFSECSFALPDDSDIAFQTRELRSSLKGFWDDLLPVLSALRERGNALQTDNLLRHLRGLVT